MKSTVWRPALVAVSACVFAGVNPAPVLAQSDAAFATDEDGIDRIIERLGSESFVERELATRELETSPAVSLEVLEDLLVRGTLDRESRRRVAMVARRRFFNEPRAAMGIMLGSQTELGLRITGTQPGFDADGTLRPDDIIADIGGTPITKTEDLQVSIISRSPGEVVPVTVVRGEETLVLPIELGAWASLSNQQAQPRQDVLEISWAFRFGEALSVGAPPTLDGPAVPAVGRRPGDRRPSMGGGTRFVVGGEPREEAGRAAGVRLSRPLTARDRSNPSSYAQRISEKIGELERQRGSTLERVRQAQERLDFAVRTNNEARQRDAERLKRQHEAILQAQTSEINRLRRELQLIRDR
ncbi:MAG: PDZ domain-containing protein [Planctomycetota bacterium]